MSFDAYNSRLPGHYSATPSAAPVADPPTQSNPPAANGQEVTTKGFIDLIESHAEGLGGREITILPTSKYLSRTTWSATITKKPATEHNDYAVILRRTVIERNKQLNVVCVELEIHSKALCAEFRKIATKSYKSTNLQTYPIKLRGPFSELFFYRKEIRELVEKQDIDADLRRDAMALNEFLKKRNGPMAGIIEDHERYIKENKVINNILWTIYPPNSLAVLNMGKIKECWLCRDVSLMEHPKMGRLYWVVSGLRLGCNGTAPGLTRQRFLTPFTGMHPMNISSLSLVPAEYYPGWDSMKVKLLERSKKLRGVLGVNLTSFGCQEICGLSWDHEDLDDYYTDGVNPTLKSKHIQERVMVDFKSFSEDESLPSLVDIQKDAGIHSSKGRFTARGMVPIAKSTKHRSRGKQESDDSDLDLDEATFDEGLKLQDADDPMAYRTANSLEEDAKVLDDIEHDTENLQAVAQATVKALHISNEEFDLIFPAFVPAFGMRTKKWAWVLSDELRNVEWNSGAFHSLELDKGTKDLVEALVKGHESKSVAFDDVIAGKGQGLVFLLHGKTGLGKTLTAESIAEYLKRPLYPISGGELSTEVSEVEERLDEIFSLAKRWDAVTLLDEADVLLCKRNSADIKRNAIVGVFLRTLEYFQGVLFLTTNRKDDFDDAFKSRIHVTISYPDLSPEARSRIWKGLITVNKNVMTDESWNGQVYDALGRLDMNGRTIKNILRTAVAFANADKQPLGARHVLRILQTEMRDVDGSSEGDQGSSARIEVQQMLDDLHRIVRSSL